MHFRAITPTPVQNRCLVRACGNRVGRTLTDVVVFDSKFQLSLIDNTHASLSQKPSLTHWDVRVSPLRVVPIDRTHGHPVLVSCTLHCIIFCITTILQFWSPAHMCCCQHFPMCNTSYEQCDPLTADVFSFGSVRSTEGVLLVYFWWFSRVLDHNKKQHWFRTDIYAPALNPHYPNSE